MKTILVTGGAGFVGSHVVDLLVKRGYRVRILDSLEPQVHGPDRRPPPYCNPQAEFLLGDVRSREIWGRALQDIDAVIHLAAAVGVGQSMYEPARYVEVNTLGTALLLDELSSRKTTVRKLIVASSMSGYGEGAYECPSCGPVTPSLRRAEELRVRDWEVHCPQCARVVIPKPTAETKPFQPTSVYAVTKRDQEELCLLFGKAYGIPAVALRFFNIYGPRQALSNPYTGVVAIFSSRLLNGLPPLVFEDGLQSRDFIHVQDIAAATLLALEQPQANGEVVNLGTGRSLSLLEMCRILQQALGRTLEAQIVGKFREGDIRHCTADTRKAERLLGFKASIPFEKGMEDLVGWLRLQSPKDLSEKAARELDQKGLLK